MPIPLSTKTEQAASLLFKEPRLSRVKQRLIDEVSENIPFCADQTPEGMERIRFSVLKLSAMDESGEDCAVQTAKRDWRDLFMSAGFGYSATEHEKWFSSLPKQPAN